MLRRELGSMTQGASSFWDYAIQVQSRNSLLISTTSHLTEDQLRHRVESGMDDLLSRRCTHLKVNQENDFKKWLVEVKRVDDLMNAERKEFENIAKASREASRRGNQFGEPSLKANTRNPPRNQTTSSSSSTPRLSKLTDTERQLLFDNEGCLKCRHFFVNHRSTNCPNAFPSAVGYRSLTQADVDKSKHALRTTTAIAAVSSSSRTEETENTPVHPVAAVLGSSHPVAYMPRTRQTSLREGARQNQTPR
jgi:hypothetical protein